MMQVPARSADSPNVVALCGGVGGAKLALGLASVLQPGALTVIVNTGDDFDHLGLHVSPDIDTVLYTLSGLVDQERGWGRSRESWAFMRELERLGSETWFQLGDRDLAMHVDRTRALRQGETLTAFTKRTAMQLEVSTRILPMCDQPVRTVVHTDIGPLEFQRYFVERRCAPAVRSIVFDGAAEALPSKEVAAALTAPDLDTLIICPSNPFLSIDPILAIPGVRRLIENISAPRIAISPIIGGDAVKGPTRKIMAELGIAVTNASIAEHYQGLIDGLIIDSGDPETAWDKLAFLSVPTLMLSLNDKKRLALDALGFAADLAGSRLSRPDAKIQGSSSKSQGGPQT